MPDTATPSLKKRNRLSDIVKLVIFLGIGFFFIYWFLLKLDPSQKEAIWTSFTHADYFWVGVTMVCCLLSHFVRALRWQLLFGPLGCRPGLGNTFGSVVVLLGILCMYGQAQEWIYNTLSEKSHSLPHIAVIVVALLVAAVASVFFYRFFRKRLLKYPLFQKIDGIIMGGVDGLKSIFYLGRGQLVLFILYSIIIYLLYIAGGLIIFQAFPETAHLGFSAAFVLYLFGSIGMTISQGGLGAYPVLVWQALALYGIGETVGLAVGWLLWASQQAVVLAVGLGFIIYFSVAKKKNKE